MFSTRFPTFAPIEMLNNHLISIIVIENLHGDARRVYVETRWSHNSLMAEQVVIPQSAYTTSWLRMATASIGEDDIQSNVTPTDFLDFVGVTLHPVITIQKTVRGFWGRRRAAKVKTITARRAATELRYRPGAAGYFEAKEEFERLA